MKYNFNRNNSNVFPALINAKRYDLIELFLSHGFEKSSSAIQGAIYNKDIDMVKYLLDKGFQFNSLSLYHAILTHDFEFIKAVYALDCPYSESAMRESCTNSSDEIFHWLYEKAKESNIKPIFNSDCYNGTVFKKNTERFIWMIETEDDLNPCTNQSKGYPFCTKCNLGNIWSLLLEDKLADDKILEYCLYKKIGLCYMALVSSIKHKRLVLVEYFIKNNCIVSPEAIAEALLQNNIELAERLYKISMDKHVPEVNPEMVLNSYVFDAVVGKSDTKVLEWLLDKKCPYDDDVISSAIADGASVDRLNWLLEKKFSFGKLCYVMTGRRSDTETILKWLYDNRCPVNDNMDELIDRYFDPFDPIIGTISDFCSRNTSMVNPSG